MLQETMLIAPDTLKFMWRGQYVFTPGAGNARGCITLCPNDCSISDIKHINDRGHIFKVRLNQTSKTTVVANVYAPTTKSEEKINFFHDIESKILDCREIDDDLIMAGDYNTPLNPSEVYKRSFDKVAKKQAEALSQTLQRLDLRDAWDMNKTSHTWTKGGASSRLDRICYSLEDLNLKGTLVDWGICKSDHAAVVCLFEKKESRPRPKRSLIPYLNNSLLTSPEHLNRIKSEVENKMQQVPVNWNPHMKLEFLKMVIRTIATEIDGKQRKDRNEKLKWVNADIEHLMEILQESDINESDEKRIKTKLQDLFTIRDSILDEQGEELASKAKWYNEGERSNKYFLNILKRKAQKCEIFELRINDQIVTDPTKINEEIVKFYSTLYNQNLTEPINDDIFVNVEPIGDLESATTTAMLTSEEILETIKTTKDSCPGPDGISYSYIKALWKTFSPIMLESWNYSVTTNELPQSHKLSLLKLLPKTGKDLRELKNWRPITLSNCDFKLISKTYAARITKAVESKLSKTQTAYLKNRTIHDNIRLIKSAILKKTNNGMVIALDAKKAFDSVRHDYIKRTLEKYGLGDFIPIFELMYKDLRTDISINGNIIKGYGIKNGVKQGDALSCIIFILSIDPLMKNLENNRNIKNIIKDRFHWPKAYGYADDITLLIDNDVNSLKAIFYEYEKFSKASGLYLNAEKTEIFTLTPTNLFEYRVRYCEEVITIKPQQQIKINGIWLHRQITEMQRLNFEEVKQKIDRQFQSWTVRTLSLMGKILIIKTFGISQILYTTSSITFTQDQHKSIRSQIFKFLWSKNFSQQNRAVDRIKRETIFTDITNGGFGLIDHQDIVEAINAKQYLSSENPNSHHPIKDLIGPATSYFNRLSHNYLDDIAKVGARKITALIENKISNADEELIKSHTNLMNIIQAEKIADLVKNPNSITVALLRQAGVETTAQMDQQTLNALRKELPPGTLSLVQQYLNNKAAGTTYNAGFLEIKNMRTHVPNNALKMTPTVKITSKLIRRLSKNHESIVLSKILPDARPEEIHRTLTKVMKLKNTRQKNIFLRIYNNDIYSKEKLYKFGLIDSPECPKCGAIETKLHLVYKCPQVLAIWNRLEELLNGRHVSSLEDVLTKNNNPTTLKIKIEILGLLIQKSRSPFGTKETIECALNKLIQVEKNNRILKSICTNLKQKLTNP
jgi:hypothetical protein